VTKLAWSDGLSRSTDSALAVRAASPTRSVGDDGGRRAGVDRSATLTTTSRRFQRRRLQPRLMSARRWRRDRPGAGRPTRVVGVTYADAKLHEVRHVEGRGEAVRRVDGGEPIVTDAGQAELFVVVSCLSHVGYGDRDRRETVKGHGEYLLRRLCGRGDEPVDNGPTPSM